MAEAAVVRTARGFKTSLESQEAAQMRAMARYWLTVEESLDGQVTALAEQIAKLAAEGKPVSVGKLYRLERYKKLLIQTQAEFARYADYAERVITQKQEELWQLGLSDSLQMLEQTTVRVGFDRLAVGAVEQMVGSIVGTAGDGGPLGNLLRLRMLKDTNGAPLPGVLDRLQRTLVNAMAQGWNPRKTAGKMKDDLSAGLDKALQIARTEQLRAYREASLQTARAAKTVSGVQRLCAHNDRTCLACLADEGAIYPLDTGVPDHVQGRCAGVFVIAGEEHQFVKGEEWLGKQDEATQRAIMGNARYDLWKQGQPFGDFATTTQHDVWGGGIKVTNIKDLAARKALKPEAMPSKPKPAKKAAATKTSAPAKPKTIAEANRNLTQVRSATPRDVDRYAPMDADMRTLNEYIGTSRSFSINSGLRSGSLNAADKKVIKTLDKLTQTGTIDQPMILYRRVGNDVLPDPASAVGSVFTDKGYMSTALVEKFYGSIAKHPTRMRITAPKGTKGLAVDAYGGGNMEAEFILPRGSRLRIDKAVKTKNGWDIDATVVIV